MADETVAVTLEKPVAGGRSLARIDGRVVLVSGGIPGERVRIALERSGKGVAFGTVVEVEGASPDRIVPDVDPLCGGLAFAHVAYPRQLDLKRAIVEDALGRIGRLRDLPPIDIVESPTREWRLRARLHVSGGRVGFYREGTHALCDAGPSGQLAPGLLDLAQDIVGRLRPDVARTVEAIVVTQSVDGAARAAHLELSRPLPRHGDVWSAGVQGSDEYTGVSAGLAASRHPVAIAGHPWVRESMASLGVTAPDAPALVRHASAFFQGNRCLLPRLVPHVIGTMRGDARVVDLYAGVGVFGIGAAAAGTSSVVCVEGDAVAAEDLVVNAAPYGARVRAVRGDVEGFVKQDAATLADAHVIVNPPRTGLSRVASEALASAHPSAVTYVSCDPATLARDMQALVASGLQVTSMTMFDLFPMTAHVETVVSLRRTPSAG